MTRDKITLSQLESSLFKSTDILRSKMDASEFKEFISGMRLLVQVVNPATPRVALAKELGLTAGGVKYHLDKLRGAGKIRHQGPTKTGNRKVIDKS